MNRTSQLLVVSRLLYQRNAISYAEKTLLKRLIFQGDSRLDSVDFDDPEFARQVVKMITSINEQQLQDTFTYLYEYCTTNHGKKISKAERRLSNNTDNSFVYGEIDFASFAAIIRENRQYFKRKGVFVDLGSGTGRPIFAAALLGEFKQLIGIELLHGLNQASNEVLRRYNRVIDAPQNKHLLGHWLHSNISFINADITQYDWSGADVVFANSTCFGSNLIHQLSALAELKLEEGSVFISLTKPLVSVKFEILSKKKYTMSWGTATVFVQRRIRDDNNGNDDDDGDGDGDDDDDDDDDGSDDGYAYIDGAEYEYEK